jgi:hypothetical protein
MPSLNAAATSGNGAPTSSWKVNWKFMSDNWTGLPRQLRAGDCCHSAIFLSSILAGNPQVISWQALTARFPPLGSPHHRLSKDFFGLFFNKCGVISSVGSPCACKA